MAMGTIGHLGAQWLPSRVDDIVCITLYNESPEALRRTLDSVLASALRARRLGRTTTLSVCIMADGAEAQHPGTTAMLQCSAEVAEVSDADCAVHHSLQAVSAWLPHERADWQVHVAWCRKRRNRGKLHSHALFFTALCPLLSPRRCWQIDAGTQVDEQAFIHIIDLIVRRCRSAHRCP